MEEYLKPIREETVRFDFEVDGEDEGMIGVLPVLAGAVGSSG